VILLCVLVLVQVGWRMLSQKFRHMYLSVVSMGIYFSLASLYGWWQYSEGIHVCHSVSIRIYFSCASMVGWWLYSVDMGNLFFPLPLCVAGTPVWCGEGCWNIQTSLWEFIFPKCSIGIYFSSALVRLCHYLICCCMSLIYVIPSYLLTMSIKSMVLSFFMSG
jgi:hypothetical protein